MNGWSPLHRSPGLASAPAVPAAASRLQRRRQCLVGFRGRLGTSRLPWRQVGAEFAGADADLAVAACQVDGLQGVLASEGSRALLEAQRLPW
jgi:hypothetical protein